MSTTKLIVAFLNGEIIEIDWSSKEQTTILKDNFLNLENCFFRGMSSTEYILLMSGTSVNKVNIVDKTIVTIVKDVYFSDVTTFGWLSTFALYDYSEGTIKIYDKDGDLVRKASLVSNSLGKDTILRRWSFSSD